jgi:hypothetical protein
VTTNAAVIYLVLHADEVRSVGLVVNQTKHWQPCSSDDIVVTKAHPDSIYFTVEIVEEHSTALFDFQQSTAHHRMGRRDAVKRELVNE